MAAVPTIESPRFRKIISNRDGWTHFREPAEHLRATLTRAGLTGRCRFLGLGESTSLTV